jgi:hypothetical protein
MNDLKEKMRYHKYDAVDVEGPFEALKTGKQYYKALFEENATDNGGYTSQSKGYTKIFFEDTHSILFRRAEKYLEDPTKNPPPRIMAARESFECEAFYVKDREGKKLMNDNGEPRIGHRITVFLLPDEDPNTEFRRQLRTLEFVDAEEEIDAEEVKEEVVTKKK